jgi:hypothetical protein
VDFKNWINADKMITLRLQRTLPVYFMIGSLQAMRNSTASFAIRLKTSMVFT